LNAFVDQVLYEVLFRRERSLIEVAIDGHNQPTINETGSW
jgi:hypothetical protein